jgi:hypothetical protein
MSEQADLAYEEMIAQPYANCVFSAGFVTGHPVDTLYLRLARGGEEPTTILLRPDEAAALAWCLTGALWSDYQRARDEESLRLDPELRDLLARIEADPDAVERDLAEISRAMRQRTAERATADPEQR